LFGISRQTYYKGEKQKRQQNYDEQRVLELVRAQRRVMPKLGTRKLYWLLKDRFKSEDIKLGRDKFFELLKKNKMLIVKKRKYIQTTDSKHWMKKYPNLTRGIVIKRPEALWVSDITYIRTEEGFGYLALITDAYSRKIMGYDLSDSLSAKGSIRALKMAIKAKNYTGRLLHHSDRGYQYCSKEYTQLLKENNIEISMTEKYDPYENALAERMNRTLKEEFLFTESFKNMRLAERTIKESVEIYNNLRPHLSCSMLTPNKLHLRMKNKTLTKI
jgi:transposase InsO family protein